MTFQTLPFWYRLASEPWEKDSGGEQHPEAVFPGRNLGSEQARAAPARASRALRRRGLLQTPPNKRPTNHLRVPSILAQILRSKLQVLDDMYGYTPSHISASLNILWVISVCFDGVFLTFQGSDSLAVKCMIIGMVKWDKLFICIQWMTWNISRILYIGVTNRRVAQGRRHAMSQYVTCVFHSRCVLYAFTTSIWDFWNTQMAYWKYLTRARDKSARKRLAKILWFLSETGITSLACSKPYVPCQIEWWLGGVSFLWNEHLTGNTGSFQAN